MAKKVYHTQIRANANLAKRAHARGERNNALSYFAVAQEGFEDACRQTAERVYDILDINSRTRDSNNLDRLMYSLINTAQTIGQSTDNLYLARLRLFSEGKPDFVRMPLRKLISIVPQKEAA